MENTVNLHTQMQNAIKKTIPDKKIGIAFSGGVDSTVLATICSKLDYDITLLTIGFEDSHDILFSKKINELLKLPHEIYTINDDEFEKISSKVNQKIKTDNLSWNENSIAFYFVAKLANKLGIKNVITANGIDELFCGYNAYRDAIKQGEQYVMELMEKKLENEKNMMISVNDVTSEFNVKLIQPFLDNNFISFAKQIPLSEKITNEDDLLRKHIIRRLAIDIGVPEESATKRKKALQYGTQIHKSLIKSR